MDHLGVIHIADLLTIPKCQEHVLKIWCFRDLPRMLKCFWHFSLDHFSVPKTLQMTLTYLVNYSWTCSWKQVLSCTIKEVECKGRYKTQSGICIYLLIRWQLTTNRKLFEIVGLLVLYVLSFHMIRSFGKLPLLSYFGWLIRLMGPSQIIRKLCIIPHNICLSHRYWSRCL